MVKFISGRSTINELLIPIDKYTYEIEFYQKTNFIGSPMIFHFKAEGYLSESNNFLIGQFKITEFPGAADKKLGEMKNLLNRYIIGVLEDINNDSFKFNWLVPELIGINTNHRHLTD